MSYDSKPGAVDDLLILRGFCSLGVLANHVLNHPAAGLVDATGVPTFVASAAARVATAIWPSTGANYVYVFFVLSGYLMGKVFWNRGYTLDRASIVAFYRRRFLRIAPLLYFNLLVCIALTGQLYVAFSFWKATLGDVLFFNNLTGQYVNPTTWSISFEMQDYLICPLFFAFLSRKNARVMATTGLAVAAAATYSYAAQHHPDNVVFNLFRFTWFFLAGYAVNLIVRYLAEDADWRAGGMTRAVGYVLFVVANAAFYACFNAHRPFVAEAILCLCAVAALILLELPRLPREPIVSVRRWSVPLALTWLGHISYGVYLWHLPILRAVTTNAEAFERVVARVRAVAGPLASGYVPAALLLAVVATLTIALSVTTYHLVELRFRPDLYKAVAS